MDPTREHLWGQLLLERNMVARDVLARVVSQRDHYVRQGHACTIGDLLLRERVIDSTTASQLRLEVEGRGRACYACRRAFLARDPRDPPNCPACGGSAALPPPGAAPGPGASGRFQAPAAGGRPAAVPQASFQASGRFPAQGPGASGRFQAPQPGGSGRFPAPGPAGYPAPGASGRFQAPQPGGSGRFPAPGPAGYPAPGASGRFPGAPTATPPPSSHRLQAVGPPAAYSPVEEGPGSGVAPSLASVRWSAPQSTASDPNDISLEASSGEFGVGKRFGRYEIIEELGRGGMGVVYKVREPSRPAEILALKVLLAGEFASPKLMERFRDEARLASKLRHPNIVAVHDAGDVDGLPFYAMDFIEGSELQDLIRQKNLSIRRGVEVLVDVARAAHHAHEQGVIHRDLKPSNVLVATDGTPYIMDFGLAKNLESDKGLTRSGVAIGTPYYMPPEQARGSHREMDARSDVYALGAILYEILTRRVPFTAKTQNELLRKIIEEEPQAPRQLRAGVPLPLETICLKALRKDKPERYPSALAMAEDLERFLNGRAIEARPPTVFERCLAKAKKNRNATLAVTGGVAALLLAGIVIAKVVSGLQDDAAAAVAQAAEREQDQQEARALADAAAEQARLAELRSKADMEVRHGLEAFADSRSAVSLVAARQALERAERFLTSAVEIEEQFSPGGRPSTAYQRGLVRRALCRWPQADQDFVQAARDPALRARAGLARGLIALRWHADPGGARQLFATAAAAPEERGADSDAVREERAASLLARGYLHVEANPAEADDLFDRALRENGSGVLGAEANGALAYLARVQGAPLGDDEHVRAGLSAADIAVRADHYRYEFLVDRAILRARSGRFEDALLDLRMARALCADGEEPDLAEAVVHAKRGQTGEMQDSLRAARGKASDRSGRVEARVSEFAQALKRVAGRPGATPSTRDPAPARPSPAPSAQAITLRDDYDGVLHFTPSRRTMHVQLEVPDSVQAVRLLAADVDKTIGLYVRLGSRPTSPSDADFKADGSDDVRLLMRRGGTPGLRTGTYHVVLHYPQPLNGQVDIPFEARFYGDGEALPYDWETLAAINIQVRADDPRHVDELKAVLAKQRAGDLPGATAALAALEAKEPDNGLLPLLRGQWLLAQKDLTAARVALERAVEKRPDVVLGPLLLGRVELASGEPGKAAACYASIIEQHPDLLEPYFLYIECCLKAGRAQEALSAARAVVDKDPTLARGRSLLGLALLLTDHTADALTELDAALRLPTAPVRNTLMALEELTARGHAGKALELFEAIYQLRLAASSQIPLEMELLRAKAMAASGSVDEAVRRLEQLKGQVTGSNARIVIDRTLEELRAGAGQGK